MVPLGMPSPIVLQQASFASGLQASGGSRGSRKVYQDESGLQVTVCDVRKGRKTYQYGYCQVWVREVLSLFQELCC